MAILRGYPGLEADILVNGVARKEYLDPELSDADTPNCTTVYIEAQEDTSFVVQLRRDGRFRYKSSQLCWSVQLDGKKVRDTLLHNNSEVGYDRATIDGTYYQTDSGSFKKSFFFSTLTTNDTPVKILDKKLLKQMTELGQITIGVHRVVIHGPSATTKTKEVTFGTEEVSEKALKGRAISRKTKLGPPVSVSALPSSITQFIDARDKPFAVFNFRYRSMNDLKAELIVPRSESPVPLENRLVDDLSREEMRELLKRQKQQIEEAARIKREGRNNVKRERDGHAVVDVDDDELSTLPAKRRCIETVDLTGD
ncbi:hypothetical protein BLS_005353 [Venturia inaequalis]|uniref:DUF7918 domain-containing protein n=1 Tax=Venturia inaequalis TaxID=5025 RepID=A0A8H3VIC9_VENIN|nr:hypothetical protein BLS_005353 [Venturia inaequalis]KAE9985902.1 hypothetical protein EG328_006742 [Venturia inaequalis]KAE9989375.1 hypothetical protein EG327_002809 [Venturia inaequalis]RDI85244.1 ATP-dependent RNA helicase [Venturia inaequalis]